MGNHDGVAYALPSANQHRVWSGNNNQQQPFNATFEDADFLGHRGSDFEHMGPYF